MKKKFFWVVLYGYQFLQKKARKDLKIGLRESGNRTFGKINEDKCAG